jgi:hypothetical protein
VGERLKPAVLKIKTVVRYLAENPPNPFASRKIALIFSFLDLFYFAPFCAVYCYNLILLTE